MEQLTMELQNRSKASEAEAETVIRAFRLLSGEEQRIAYAVLEGMNLQKELEEQRNLKQQ